MGDRTITTTWDYRFIEMAKIVASWSKDPSTKVGAVAVNSKHHIVGIGFNGFAKGIADDERLHDREIKYKLIIHAEENVLLHATGRLEQSTLYIYPFLPCSLCASKLIQAGVSKIVTMDYAPERWADSFKLSEQLFAEAGVEVLKIPIICGETQCGCC